MITYGSAELLLDIWHELRQLFPDSDVESLLFLLCVLEATMRPFMNTISPEPGILSDPEPPNDVRGFISRRAIADKLGLSRETVRRKTAELAKLGYVAIDRDHGVRMSYALADAASWRRVENSHRAILRYLDRLDSYGLDPRNIPYS